MKSFLFDELGKFSAKRLVGVLAALTLIGVTVADIFMDVTVSQNILDDLFYLCLGSLGFTSIDKFINPK